MPKIVGDKTYVHRSALSELDRWTREAVWRARDMARVPKGWSIVRLAPGSVMFGWTESFDTEPHPALLRAFTVSLDDRGKVTGHRDTRYSPNNPPIYHRKEQMLPADHPRRAEFERLTQAEEQAGLLGRPDIGRRKRWEALLAQEGFTMSDHRKTRQGSRSALSDALERAERGSKPSRASSSRSDPLARALAAASGQAPSPSSSSRRRSRRDLRCGPGRVPIPWRAEDVSGPNGEPIGRMDAAKARRVGSKHSRDPGNRDLAPNTAEKPFNPLPCFDDYDLIAVQYSGGKDSTACLLMVLRLLRGRPDLLKRVEIWHQDIDGHTDPFMDWPVTLPYCEAVAELFDLPLVVNYREGGFKGEILRRPGQARGRKMLASKQHGPIHVGQDPRPGEKGRRRFPAKSPSLTTRWCTGELKIDVAKAMYGYRATRGQSKILTITGERVEESSARANYFRGQPISESSRRQVHQLRIVYDHAEGEVWEEYRHAFPGKPYALQPHPVYEVAWSRCSCAGCVFSGPKDWAMLRQVAPTFYQNVATLERELGEEALAANPQAPAQIARIQREHEAVRQKIAAIESERRQARAMLDAVKVGRKPAEKHGPQAKAAWQQRRRIKAQRKEAYDRARQREDRLVGPLRRQRDEIAKRLGEARGIIGRNIDAAGSVPQLVQSWFQRQHGGVVELLDPKLKALWVPYLMGEKPWTVDNMLRGPGAPVFTEPWDLPAGAFGESGGPC